MMNPHLPRGVRLRHDTIRNRWVLLAPERIFEVDDIGVEILKRCDGRNIIDMLHDLATAFSVKPDDIREDVETFLKDFAQKRVVEL
jgi:pyrroloquinoline quinone biosynthesis protein D